MAKRIFRLFGLVWLLCFPLSAPCADVVKIAAIFSETGIAADHNAPLIEMTRFAVDEINDRGGILGAPVELTVFDNQSTRIGSVVAAENAVKAGVSAVIGAFWSSHSLAQAPILQKAKIPMISPGSTNPDVTKIGNYIFRVCFIDSFQGKAMAEFARRDLRAETAAVLKNLDEDYCMTLARFFKESFARLGGKIVHEAEYRGKAVDFSDILRGVESLSPNVVYIPGYGRDSGLIVRQAKSMGIETVFLGGDAWDDIFQYGLDAVNGSYQSAAWHQGAPFAASLRLQKIHKEKTGHEIVNAMAPLAYDAVMLLSNAIGRAGSSNPEIIRDALAATVDFDGATGKIRFDENGDPIGKDVFIIRLENGTRHYVKTIAQDRDAPSPEPDPGISKSKGDS